MIEFPSLPTDSLYKFLALSGLLVIFASIFLYLKLRREIHDKIYKVECSHAENDARIGYLEGQENPDSEQVSEVRALASVAKLETQEVRRLWDEFRKIRHLFTIFVIIGALMAGTGFHLWYKKIQIHQDVLLQLKVEELRQSANQTVNRTP